MKFRKAIEADIKVLFDWANDLDVRQNALNSQLITWEGHEKWFQNRL